MAAYFSKTAFWLILLFFAVTLVIGCIFFIGPYAQTFIQYLQAYQNTSHTSSWQGLFFSEIIQIIISLCGILPASTAAFGSGLLYGIWKGFLLSASATLIGAIISFLLSRSIFRPLIEKFLRRSSRMQKLDHLLHIDGWKLVCLLRISPIMPFAVTSYALGLTSISFRSYLIGTLASLPALFGYVLMGHIANTEANNIQNQHIHFIQHLLFIVAFIGTGILVWHLSKLLNKILKIPKQTS
ncbi:TVP38/TMEM64 family protein [Commensalibacter oyaizuii]|uniref:TVP38/TMEM64 family membrane protein n=1 Tax=Commensalibacter oyaizuii TaxID=3043873 RepID=A0ABT6PZ49_9PROT|nr:VTT domain-containing protein [Commensalibacter sp. TBRC 16381]MDI2090133.1 VTT domain-containing protein [Commensalibacter sp. TBRC 16381]